MVKRIDQYYASYLTIFRFKKFPSCSSPSSFGLTISQYPAFLSNSSNMSGAAALTRRPRSSRACTRCACRKLKCDKVPTVRKKLWNRIFRALTFGCCREDPPVADVAREIVHAHTRLLDRRLANSRLLVCDLDVLSYSQANHDPRWNFGCDGGLRACTGPSEWWAECSRYFSLLSPFCRDEQLQDFNIFRSTAKHPQGLYRRCVELCRLARHPNPIWASLPWATVEVQIYFIRFFCGNQPRGTFITPDSSEMSCLPS